MYTFWVDFKKDGSDDLEIQISLFLQSKLESVPQNFSYQSSILRKLPDKLDLLSFDEEKDFAQKMKPFFTSAIQQEK